MQLRKEAKKVDLKPRRTGEDVDGWDLVFYLPGKPDDMDFVSIDELAHPDISVMGSDLADDHKVSAAIVKLLTKAGYKVADEEPAGPGSLKTWRLVPSA